MSQSRPCIHVFWVIIFFTVFCEGGGMEVREVWEGRRGESALAEYSGACFEEIVVEQSEIKKG